MKRVLQGKVQAWQRLGSDAMLSPCPTAGAIVSSEGLGDSNALAGLALIE